MAMSRNIYKVSDLYPLQQEIENHIKILVRVILSDEITKCLSTKRRLYFCSLVLEFLAFFYKNVSCFQRDL